MADYTFFFNPMSRAQIARWALHEAKADYEPVLVEWDNKPQALLAANPMGKLPTIIHHHQGHDHVVSEAAAVCHYLAEMSAPDLLPRTEEKADYFRWLFFASGPVEQAVTAKSMGWEEGDRHRMVGFGSFDLTIDALDGWLSTHDYVCGKRFTMADVYVGSQIMWGLRFGSMPERASFKAYWDRCGQRPAYQEGSAIDMALIAEMQSATQTEA
ncbi:MAG: glutathione S-transferase family protein [Porphyrobacter sp.]|nr:glutathione S-transferase family protein [Porphyrobacter sp.]